MERNWTWSATDSSCRFVVFRFLPRNLEYFPGTYGNVSGRFWYHWQWDDNESSASRHQNRTDTPNPDHHRFQSRTPINFQFYSFPAQCCYFVTITTRPSPLLPSTDPTTDNPAKTFLSSSAKFPQPHKSDEDRSLSAWHLKGPDNGQRN